MRMILRLLLLCLVMMMAMGQTRALAQAAPPADKVKVAKQYVDAGLAAQSTGDYDTAITMYSKAYQLVPHPLLIFNMAQAHRLAGHIDQALTLYARYLEEDPSGAQAQTARELVAELRASKAKAVQRTAPAGKTDAAHKANGTDAEDEDQPAKGAGTNARKSREPAGDSPTGGTLVVKARSQGGGAIDQGTVMIDEEPKGNLADGKLTVAGISEGRHAVAIEAGGYRRFEEIVTVHDGERARLDALLLDQVAPSPSSQGTVWKVSLGASAAVAVAGLAYGYYSYEKMLAHRGAFEPAIDPATGFPYTDAITAPDASDCGQTPAEIAFAKHSKVLSQSNFDRACTWKSRIYLGFDVGAIGIVGAVVSLILLSRDTGSPETPAAGAHRKKSDVAIMPIVTPGGGGAAFSLAW